MSETIYKGPGLLTTLFVIFLVLKLTGNIDWSWWYVTLPIWMIPVIVLGIIAVTLIICLIMIIVELIVSLFE